VSRSPRSPPVPREGADNLNENDDVERKGERPVSMPSLFHPLMNDRQTFTNDPVNVLDRINAQIGYGR
jgi:hypothetical protein